MTAKFTYFDCVARNFTPGAPWAVVSFKRRKGLDIRDRDVRRKMRADFKANYPSVGDEIEFHTRTGRLFVGTISGLDLDAGQDCRVVDYREIDGELEAAASYNRIAEATDPLVRAREARCAQEGHNWTGWRYTGLTHAPHGTSEYRECQRCGIDDWRRLETT